MHKQEHLVLIYFRPNVNKTSRCCELDAFSDSVWSSTKKPPGLDSSCLSDSKLTRSIPHHYCSFLFSTPSLSSSVARGSPGCQSTLAHEPRAFPTWGTAKNFSVGSAELEAPRPTRARSAAAFLSPSHLNKQVAFPPAFHYSREEPGSPFAEPVARRQGCAALEVKGSERQLYIQYTRSNLLLRKTICFSVLQSSEGKL